MALAWATGTSRRASGWEGGEKAARTWGKRQAAPPILGGEDETGSWWKAVHGHGPADL